MIVKTSFYRLSPLALAIAFLTACSTPAPTKPVVVVPPPAAIPKFKPTLASLDSVKVPILKDPEPAANFADPAERLNKLQPRTNPLTGVTEVAPNSDGLEVQINEKLNEALYNQLVADAKKAKDPGTATAYLKVARRLKTGSGSAADKAEQEMLEKNVDFYQDLLERMPASESRAEIYYELAKNYDLLTKKEESVAALKMIAEKYPSSPHLTEVRFRLAEDAFANRRFLEAADYYGKVLSDKKTDFYDQSLYKRGWSFYRASDYESALPEFFGFAEKIWIKPKKSKQEQEALDDALEVISLSFIQLEGAKSADVYFDKVGEKFYESIIYNNLAKAYIGKKLYKEAADTYNSFINRHPFDPTAPDLSTAVINVYELGGFPSLVVTAKEDFVKHYDANSAFWQQADEATRTKLRPTLEGHIVDLAKHYHALAQINNLPTDYQKAATWYRAHLSLNPKEEDAIVVNQLLAEVLYSAKDYKSAIVEFEKTAYEYNNPKGAESAYFALLSYQDWDKSLANDLAARKDIFPKRAASTYKFAEKFPQDPNTAVVMQGVIQYIVDNYTSYDDSAKQLSADLEANIFKFAASQPQDKNAALLLQGLTNLYLNFKDFDGAVRTSQTLLAMNPPVDEKLRLDATAIIANAYFDKGNWEEADKSYQQVLAFNIADSKQKASYQDRLATTYYRQAEKFRDDKNPEQAAQAFLKAAQAAADPKLRASSDFDAATVLLNGEKYKEAIPVLIAFRDKYPDNPLSQDIPEKLAVAYEKTDDLSNAAQQYQVIAARDLKKNPAAAREALWLAAETYEKIKQPEAAIKVYQQYIADTNNPVDQRAEATFRLYTYYSKNNLNTEAQNSLKSLAQTYDKLADKASPRVRYFGAMAHFKMSQPLYDSFAAITLKQPLKVSLAAKKKAMQAALGAYNKVALIGVAEFTTAANYQQAQIYQKLSADLLASERPKGLSELELEQYGILLEEQAEPLADKAIGIYTVNANLVKEQVYDSYVQKSFAALAELSPGRYKKTELVESSIDEIY
ncbi:tetratricopeptide repeat protein [Agitococcus lubricus]|uniref:Tetratricopeptide repeat protein n=1 Tax=Agitococcus lubricus TaxID=1077255 RepID=A0A2T5IW84_9GAMM|nr:tetratricopeptide repeat protein [Agitococcus lubricus]PTQ88179.1 tetratricopeptide repeat protein [Agitococcus lubricus]